MALSDHHLNVVLSFAVLERQNVNAGRQYFQLIGFNEGPGYFHILILKDQEIQRILQPDGNMSGSVVKDFQCKSSVIGIWVDLVSYTGFCFGNAGAVFKCDPQ